MRVWGGVGAWGMPAWVYGSAFHRSCLILFLHLNTVLPLIGAVSCVLVCRRLVAGRDVFHDIHIVALPWPDSIGSAGTSTHIEAYEKAHGVKVRALAVPLLYRVW